MSFVSTEGTVAQLQRAYDAFCKQTSTDAYVSGVLSSAI